MITEKDLQEAIAECQGQRNPNANTCIKLAAFYTIRKELYGNKDTEKPVYSFAGPPKEYREPCVYLDSGSEFSNIVNGKTPEDIWPVIDELMNALQVLYPRLYNSVIEKLEER